MGREAQALVSFGGASAEATVLLESTELILRGGVKAKLPRAALSNVRAGHDGLRLLAGGEPLHLAMPEAEAQRWAIAISTPPPSLAHKLGIGSDKLALVVGEAADPTLTEVLANATTADVAAAKLLIALIEDHAALRAALAKAEATELPCWCVYPKGKAADPGDAAIRELFRSSGWMDNKSCAVSDRLTATRYARKR